MSHGGCSSVRSGRADSLRGGADPRSGCARGRSGCSSGCGGFDDSLRIGNDSSNGCGGGRGTVFGDHAQLGDGKAAISSAGTHGPTCFVTNEFYVMAHMRLEINTAGGDLKNLTSAIFCNCVVAISSTQATLNVGRVRVAARSGVCANPQRQQQGRYNHQQKYFFHGILL